MSTSSTPMRSLPVTFEKVSKHFGSVIAVDEVDLHVQEGEFMVLLGPSGCGKTTSLRMIAGLETATAGTIKIGDTVINKVPPRARNVAMVFQSYALYPHMKVADNIGYPLKIRKTSKARIGERVKEVTAMLRIPELLDRKPRELSGGQRQRVALARAIIREPNVFLFDEPLSNLDAELRLEMRGELKYLQRQLGTTAIYVTHDQAEALAMADRITVMREAKVLQVGSPMDIYDRPANAFVGHFVGSPGMSLVSGTLTSTNGWVRVIGNGFSWDVSGDAAIAVLRRPRVDRQAIAGARPEAMELSFTEQAGYAKTSIFAVEPMGSEVLVDVLLDEDTRIKARAETTFAGQPGEAIWIRPKPDRIRLFDGESQEAIE